MIRLACEEKCFHTHCLRNQTPRTWTLHDGCRRSIPIATDWLERDKQSRDGINQSPPILILTVSQNDSETPQITESNHRSEPFWKKCQTVLELFWLPHRFGSFHIPSCDVLLTQMPTGWVWKKAGEVKTGEKLYIIPHFLKCPNICTFLFPFAIHSKVNFDYSFEENKLFIESSGFK